MATAEPTPTAAEAVPPGRAAFHRARVYRTLAALYRAPEPRALGHLKEAELPALPEALAGLGAPPALVALAGQLLPVLAQEPPEELAREYDRLFEATGGLACPPHETTLVADTPQEGLTRTFRMADVAGFYRAFGVEMRPGTERPDHIAAELEFAHLLSVKELVALERGDGDEAVAVCRDASRSFLRDHLHPFALRLAERIPQASARPPFSLAGRLLGGFVDFDARAIGAV